VTPGYDASTEHGHNKSAYFSEGLEAAPVEGKELYTDAAAAGASISAKGYDSPHADETTTPKPNRKKMWIIGGTILLIVIIAAVVGGVLGSRKSSSTTDASSPASSGTPAGSANTTTTSTGTSATATATTNVQHSIAAIGWNTSRTIFNRRLYYVDNTSLIYQALQASDDKWSLASLAAYGKPGTPLAVAVTRPGFTLVSLVSVMR